MHVEWRDDEDVFDDPAWARAWRLDPEATIFHRPSFLGRYREALGRGRLAVALVGDQGPPVAACAFEIEDEVLRFLGGFEATDYEGPVGDPAVRRSAAAALMAALAARAEWGRADLRGLRGDGSWLVALEDGAREAGLKAETSDDAVAPFLELERSWDEYLAGLNAKLRHEIRRKRRRLLDVFPEARAVDATAETLPEAADRFVELHRSSPGQKGRFLDDDMERYFRRLATELFDDGSVKLTALHTSVGILATTIGFCDGHVFRLYNSAYDRRHAELAPGMVLLGMVIEDVIAGGYRAVDLLRDDLEYKYRFGARPRPLTRLVLARP
jgi:CelD/BcsL family acetyltransferase involved in cellulose biosynthesis